MQIGFHYSFLKEFFSLFLFTILVFPKILFQFVNEKPGDFSFGFKLRPIKEIVKDFKILSIREPERVPI